jgi:hypothetical protein
MKVEQEGEVHHMHQMPEGKPSKVLLPGTRGGMVVQAPGEENILLQEVGRVRLAEEDNQLVQKLELQVCTPEVAVRSIPVMAGLPAAGMNYLVSADQETNCM